MPERCRKNASAFYLKRLGVWLKTYLRFSLNALAFFKRINRGEFPANIRSGFSIPGDTDYWLGCRYF